MRASYRMPPLPVVVARMAMLARLVFVAKRRAASRLKIAASHLEGRDGGEGGAGGLRSDVACRIALPKTASRYKTPHDGDRFA